MKPKEINELLEVIARALDLEGDVTITFSRHGPFVPRMGALRIYRNGEQVVGWEKYCEDHGEKPAAPGPLKLARIETFAPPPRTEDTKT